jgi:hypothetical protein
MEITYEAIFKINTRSIETITKEKEIKEIG